jgi:hypothetical protein
MSGYLWEDEFFAMLFPAAGPEAPAAGAAVAAW